MPAVLPSKNLIHHGLITKIQPAIRQQGGNEAHHTITIGPTPGSQSPVGELIVTEYEFEFHLMFYCFPNVSFECMTEIRQRFELPQRVHFHMGHESTKYAVRDWGPDATAYWLTVEKNY